MSLPALKAGIYYLGAVVQLVTCLPAGRERCPVMTMNILRRNMFTIYALCFETDRIYVGMTGNLQQRISYHQRQKVKSTKHRGLFTVVIIEQCPDRISARAREKYWKSGYGKERLKIWSGSSVGYPPTGRQGTLPTYCNKNNTTLER